MNSTGLREAAFRLPSGFRLSLLAVAIASAQGVAYAQAPTPPADQPAEEIIITGSRIRLDGMETSNPVTVVTPQQLSLTAPTTLIEGMAELPQFYQSNTTTNTGGFFTTPGAGTLNLAGLQGKRTLTLLSGRRVVSSTIYGGPDINLFPEKMLRTVETRDERRNGNLRHRRRGGCGELHPRHRLHGYSRRRANGSDRPRRQRQHQGIDLGGIQPGRENPSIGLRRNVRSRSDLEPRGLRLVSRVGAPAKPIRRERPDAG